MAIDIKTLTTLSLTFRIGDGVKTEQGTLTFAPWAAPLQIETWIGQPQEDETLLHLVQKIAERITAPCFGPNVDVSDIAALPKRGTWAHDELSREAKHTADQKEQDGIGETKTKALANRTTRVAAIR